jgi:acyl dehydratase
MTSTERRYATITPESLQALRNRLGIPVERDDRGKYTYINADAARNFSIGTGDANPFYTDEDYARATRWGTVLAPPGILLAAGLPEGRDATPEENEAGRGGALPGVHGMFAGRDYEWYEPIVEGDRLFRVTYEAGFIEKEGRFAGRQILQLGETLFRNQHGRVVAKALGSRMRTERDAARGRKAYWRDPHVWTPEELDRIDEAYENELPRGAEPRYWEDVQVGDPMGEMVRGPYRITDAVAWEIGWGGPYARTGRVDHEFRKRHPRAYTRNRLGVWDVVERVHWEESFAQEIGVPAIYDYGAQRVAWVCNFVTNWMGDDAFLKRLWVSIRRFNIEGDALWHRGEVIEKRIVDGEYQVICDFWAENQLGEVTAPGQAVVLLPSRTDGYPKLPAKGQPEYPKWGPTTKLTPLGVEPLPPSTTHGFLPFGLMS